MAPKTALIGLLKAFGIVLAVVLIAGIIITLFAKFGNHPDKTEPIRGLGDEEKTTDTIHYDIRPYRDPIDMLNNPYPY